MSEIQVKLSGDNSEYRSMLDESNVATKTFGNTMKRDGAAGADALTEAVHSTNKSMRLFKEFLIGGGIVETLKKFYETAIAYAEKHTEDTDAQTEAVRRFGGALKETEGTVAKAMTQVLGFFNQAGEGMGMLISRIAYGNEQAQKAAAITSEAEKTIADLAKQHAETLKQIDALQTASAAAAEKNKQADFDALDAKTKIAILTKSITEGLATAATLEENSVAFQQTKLDVITWQGQLIKLGGEEAKAQTAELQKQTDELKKQNDAKEKYNEGIDAEYNKLKMQALPAEEQITLLQQHQSDLQSEMAGKKQDSIVYEQDYIELAKTNKEISTLTLGVQKDTTGEIKNQIAEEKKLAAIVAQMKSDLAAGYTNALAISKGLQVGVNGAPDYTSMSTAMLEGLIKKQNDLLNTVTDFNLGGGGGGQIRNAQMSDYGNWLAAQTANTQIGGAQKELSQRSQIQQYAAQYGQSAAAGQFGDRAVANALTAQNSVQTNTLNALTAVVQTLNKVFPSQATPVTSPGG